MKQYSFLGDDDKYPIDDHKHWNRDVLASAGIILTIWIVVGALVFSWIK